MRRRQPSLSQHGDAQGNSQHRSARSAATTLEQPRRASVAIISPATRAMCAIMRANSLTQLTKKQPREPPSTSAVSASMARAAAFGSDSVLATDVKATKRSSAKERTDAISTARLEPKQA